MHLIEPMNDLWAYDESENVWYWIDGTNIPFNYGSSSYPPALDSASYYNHDGVLWMFGGIYGNLTISM